MRPVKILTRLAARMRSLMRIFAGRTCPKVRFLTLWLISHVRRKEGLSERERERLSSNCESKQSDPGTCCPRESLNAMLNLLAKYEDPDQVA